MNNYKFKILPSFFVIGFQKSATSTLHQILKESNRISLPIIKETHFFSDDKIFSRGYNWYESQFNINHNHLISGEVDPSYIYFPEAYNNIKKYIDSPKFIIIIRKPIDRAFSHYQMSFKRGYEKESFKNALKEEKNRLSSKDIFCLKNFSYMSRSDYTKQISKVKDKFKKSEFLFLDFDDFQNEINRKSMIRKIFNFINIELDDKLLDMNFHKNKSFNVRFKFIQRLLYKDFLIKRIVSKIVKSDIVKNKFKNFILNLNTSNADYDNDILNYKELSNDIIKWNNKEVVKLENLLDKKLNKWLI